MPGRETQARSVAQERLIRRAKRGPDADMWHTLAVGAPIAVVLLIVLPWLF